MPDWLHWFMDFVLHLDRSLDLMVATYHVWIYGILFVVIFAETGLVVTPFLPGDSLLFAVGALAARDSSVLSAPLAIALLGLAAVLGNTTNYGIGRIIGPKAFNGRSRLFKVEHLHRTEEFFDRYGGMAIVLSRFMPIIRTFAPFVAGISHMPYTRFQAYNLLGGFSWVVVGIGAGYLLGSIPVVSRNFNLMTLLVVVVSLLPMAIGLLKRRPAGAHG